MSAVVPAAVAPAKPTRPDSRRRVISDQRGPGVLIEFVDRFGWCRFEPDAGEPLDFEWRMRFIGLPEDLTAKGDVRSRIPRANEAWFTMRARQGWFFSYRWDEAK